MATDQTTRLEVAALRAENGSDIIYRVANGSATEEVATESGPIPTLAKKVEEIGRGIPLPGNQYTLGDVMAKAQTGAQVVITCYGDSLTYGQDTTSNGQATQINGASQTRSMYPYPETLNEALGFAGYSRSVNNYGYPGDTSVMGLERWKDSGPSDVSIIMYGTNDATPVDGTPRQTVSEYRQALRQFVDRERIKGAAVVVMAPPQVESPGNNTVLRAYAYAAREVADEYGVAFVDAQEQLFSINVTQYWTDGIHLSTFAYNELGWQLSALILRRDGAALKISPGATFNMAELPGAGGFIIGEPAARGGKLVRLSPGNVYPMGFFCEEDVRPVITSYNAGSSPSKLVAYYSSGRTTFRGTDAPYMTHEPAKGVRKHLSGVVMKRGFRTLFVQNNGTTDAFIESIRFVGSDQPVYSGAASLKSSALSGIYCPNAYPSDFWVSVADQSVKVELPCELRAWVTLPSGAESGIALWNRLDEQDEFLGDFIWLLRNGTGMEVRQRVGGSLTTINTTASVFTSGASFTGELSIKINAQGQLSVSVDGSDKATGLTPPFTKGFPGFIGAKATKWVVTSMLVSGSVKPVY